MEPTARQWGKAASSTDDYDDVVLEQNPYSKTSPRRSSRLKDKPRVGSNMFQEDTKENNDLWHDLIRQYEENVGKHLPDSRTKELLSTLWYFGT